MKKVFIPIAIVASVLLLAILIVISTNTSSAIPAQAPLLQHNSGAKTITVTGTGLIKVSPDFASISLSVETTHQNSATAQKENIQIIEELVNALERHGITKNDISTGWFGVYPIYDYNYFVSSRVNGYRVTNQLNVKVRDVDNVGKVFDIATAAGANIAHGVHFGIEDNTSAYSKALIKAIDSAKRKVAVLMTAANFSEMRIISIKESPFSHFSFNRYAAMDGGHTNILNSDIEVTATVEVVFGG